jgi:hypothetical protein
MDKSLAKDPLYERLHVRSYADDDPYAALVLAILRNALDEYLGYRVPDKLREQAKHFIYHDNDMFEVAMMLLGYNTESFRQHITEMRSTKQRLRKPRND